MIIWDRGSYEQGGRVPWPQALDRGHAVFVLPGEAARRVRAPAHGPGREGAMAADQAPRLKARPGSDIVSERPESVVSGRTLDEVLRDGQGG